jgi:hypothetical protein
MKNGAVELPVIAAARVWRGGRQGGDAEGLEAKEEGMMVRLCGNVKGNTRSRLKEGGEVHTVKAGRRLTTTKPGKLNLCRKENTKGVNITERGNNIKEFLGEFSIRNKGEVLRVYLVYHAVGVPHQDGRHRLLKRGV